MRAQKNNRYRPKWETRFSRSYTEQEIKELADRMLEWISGNTGNEKNTNFWLNDFAAENMLSPSGLRSFALKCGYFSSIYEICKSIQQSKLLKMALYKEVNAAPAVFILKSVIGSEQSGMPADMDEAKLQVEEIFEH